MNSQPRVLIHNDKTALMTAVGELFITSANALLAEREMIHVVLTGGSVGVGCLAAVGQSDSRDSVDWARVHLWWGDERWLPAGDPERNDQQATDALLGRIDVPDANVHRFPASDAGLELDAAAQAYETELAGFGDETGLPRFDLTFLGVGDDAHIASLFPGREEVRVTGRNVVPVRNSPKPPPERLSLTLPAINSSDRIWLVLAGADKASALGQALTGADSEEIPVAGVSGRLGTTFFVDQAAAAEVPAEMRDLG